MQGGEQGTNPSQGTHTPLHTTFKLDMPVSIFLDRGRTSEELGEYAGGVRQNASLLVVLAFYTQLHEVLLSILCVTNQFGGKKNWPVDNHKPNIFQFNFDL